tara:strand:+ start:866 stop:1303 length:438 start_codon:yes stop_codon:yes gene_type:complete
MHDIFTLTQMADDKLNAANDYYFNEQTETLLGVLRSSGVVPYNRTSQNGFLHKLFSAALVVAYNEDSPIYISSRKADAYLNRGMTTNTIKWLDRMCREGLLVSEGYKYKAEGRCKLAPLINDMLSRVEVYTRQPHRESEQLVQGL